MILEGKALGLMIMVIILLLFAIAIYLIALPNILEGKGIDLKKLRQTSANYKKKAVKHEW